MVWKSKNAFSKELSIILEDNCLACYCHFDEKQRRPCIVYPCQHYFCKLCVDTDILSQNGGVCLQCRNETSHKNIKESRMLLKIIKIINMNKTQTDSQEILEALEKEVAIELYKTGEFFACPQCDEPFDRIIRQPNIVCCNEHLICSECLKKQRFSYCPKCDEKTLEDLHPSKLIIHACEFIKKVLFDQKVEFVVNDREYTITTQTQTRIKDLFFKLRDVGILSQDLQIKDCHFTAEFRGEAKQEMQKISYDQRIGDKVKKIYLQFDERAMHIGARVTMSSRIVKELPIKISDFKPINSLKYEVDDDDDDDQQFGAQYLPQKSQLNMSNLSAFVRKKQSLRISEEPSYYQVPHRRKEEFDENEEFGELSENSVEIKSKRQIENQYLIRQISGLSNEKAKIESPSYSKHEKSLINISRIRSKIFQEEKQEIKAIKISRIPRISELPNGTKVSEDFIENINTKSLPATRKEVLQKFLKNHEVSPADEQLLCYQVHKMTKQPFSKQEMETHNKMEKEIEAKVRGGDKLSMILQILKRELEDGQIKVAFTPKSSDRSKLTLKVLTSHYLTDRVIVRETIDEDERFYFEKCSKSEQQFKRFVQFKKEAYEKRFGVRKESLVVHELVKGSMILTTSTDEVEALTRHVKQNLDMNIQIHPYFTHLQLSPEDFDSKGNIQFKDVKNDIEFRGNWPYYQPISSYRYGIKVLGQFDNGSNTWLKMNNVPGEWAVGFHGVRNPNAVYKQHKNVIQSILKGLHRPGKQMIINIENSSQGCKSSRCERHPSQQVGTGVYLTPFFKGALAYTNPYEIGDKSYRLVFQCRLKPEEIHIPLDKNEYWVVRESKYIRPYGIVLYEGDKQIYPSPVQQFKQKFVYRNYAQRIEGVPKNHSISTE